MGEFLFRRSRPEGHHGSVCVQVWWGMLLKKHLHRWKDGRADGILLYAAQTLVFLGASGLGRCGCERPRETAQESSETKQEENSIAASGNGGRGRKTHRCLVEMDDASIGAPGGTQRTVVVLVSKTQQACDGEERDQ